MGYRTCCVALVVSCLSVAGCGTVANVVKAYPAGKEPFGGVAHDCACFKEATSAEPDDRPHPKPEVERFSRGCLAVCSAVDLPFSLVGDVLTWPYTKVYRFINEPSVVVPFAGNAPPVNPPPPVPALPPAPPPPPVSVQPTPPPANLPPIPQYTPSPAAQPNPADQPNPAAPPGPTDAQPKKSP